MIGVLLCSFGTPRSLDEVPAFLQRVLGRAPTQQHIDDLRLRYRSIGGSPLITITQSQATALQEALRERLGGVEVAVGMRYSEPSIEGAVTNLVEAGVDEIVVLRLAPQFVPGDEEYVAAIKHQITRGRRSVRVRVAAPWYFHPRYIGALARRVREILDHGDGPSTIYFTAHSVPRTLEGVESYVGQLEATAGAVAQAAGLGTGEWNVTFQSGPRNGGRGWLGPQLLEAIAVAASKRGGRIVVCPIQFVSDHLEVLYDIDVEAKNLAGQLGYDLIRTQSLNDDPGLIVALRDAVVAAVMPKVAAPALP